MVTAKKFRHLTFDPRTKMLLMLTMSVFVLGNLGNEKMETVRLMFSALPLVLLLIMGRIKAALGFILLWSGSLLLQIALLPLTSGFINYFILATCGIIIRFIPSIMVAYLLIFTTTVSEFVAAMERMKVTEKIIIPFSVIFRFFPTVIEEYRAITDAMRMRGVSLGGGKPTAMLEYRLIPMMTCSLKIGEELSAAALTRGLGAPIKRTNICKIGFHIQDFMCIGLCCFVVIYYLLGVFHVV